MLVYSLNILLEGVNKTTINIIEGASKIESCSFSQWYTLTVLLYQYILFLYINLREHQTWNSPFNIMPGSHSHGTSRRISYGKNLTDDRGKSSRSWPIRIQYGLRAVSLGISFSMAFSVYCVVWCFTKVMLY